MGCIFCLHSHHDLCWWSHLLPGTVFATDHKRRLQVNFLIWSDSRIFKHHRLAQCLVIFSYEYLLVISSRVLFVKSVKLQPLPSYESFRSYKVASILFIIFRMLVSDMARPSEQRGLLIYLFVRLRFQKRIFCISTSLHLF